MGSTGAWRGGVSGARETRNDKTHSLQLRTPATGRLAARARVGAVVLAQAEGGGGGGEGALPQVVLGGEALERGLAREEARVGVHVVRERVGGRGGARGAGRVGAAGRVEGGEEAADAGRGEEGREGREGHGALLLRGALRVRTARVDGLG